MAYAFSYDADNDLRDIWHYTFGTWGQKQADRYFDQIIDCCEVIGAGQGQRRRWAVLPERVHFHRCQHHYIFYREEAPMTVFAILHESMDLVSRIGERLASGSDSGTQGDEQ